MIKKILMGCAVLFCAINPALADEEAGNRAYVQSGEYGLFYLKSVPAESYGLKGKTQVFQVMPEQDKLLFTYDWYSPELYLTGFLAGPSVYVVKFGSWTRGHVANTDDLAVAFYKNDQLLKEYSTLDIVKDEKNVSASVSHYTVFKKRLGFRRPFGNQIIFDVEKENGDILSFDVDTGKIVSKEDEILNEKIYNIQSKMGQIKWKWYEANKDKLSDINTREITEEDLKAIDPENYPVPPEGYRIIPHKMWDQVEVIKK
jgi:hypothetical protein